MVAGKSPVEYVCVLSYHEVHEALEGSPEKFKFFFVSFLYLVVERAELELSANRIT